MDATDTFVEIQPIDFHLSAQALETLIGYFHTEPSEHKQTAVAKPIKSVNKLKISIDQPSFTFSTNTADAKELSLVIDASQIFLINEPIELVQQNEITGTKSYIV